MRASGGPRWDVIDLRRLTGPTLEHLLSEETLAWAERLHWDFQPSAELVLRYVGMHALDGVALLEDGEPAGYSYFVLENRKGLIGDFYVRESSRSAMSEGLLLRGVLDSIGNSPYVQRIEAQLLMAGTRLRKVDRSPAAPSAYERLFMLAPLSAVEGLPAQPERALICQWGPQWLAESAALIAKVYEQHVDSQINDQYRSSSGARRFLENIVQYPGCGQFCAPASWQAKDAETGELLGIALASEVARDVGHVTQICVAPGEQGHGLGYELLRRTLVSLRRRGCREATLTVTSMNHPAIRLYESVGFTTMSRFDAYVWEGPL
jgi:ribosomal protein S18 acetylase RimI-like enzyme